MTVTAPGRAPSSVDQPRNAAPPPWSQGSRRRSWLGPLLWLLLGALVGSLATIAVAPRLAEPAPPPAPTAVPTGPRLTARGEVRPVERARVAALTGGAISQLPILVGDPVEERQELARVKAADGSVEVLTAPYRGTVAAVPVHYGDTVTPGTVVAVVGDLSRLQVETTDVDEFIIGHVAPGQAVEVAVDALDRRTYRGYVRRVALLPERDENGDEHYPVVVDLVGSTDDLRLGMTVRINFGG